jgi:hypothetical protein
MAARAAILEKRHAADYRLKQGLSVRLSVTAERNLHLADPNTPRPNIQGVSKYMEPMSLLIILPILMFLLYFFQI